MNSFSITRPDGVSSTTDLTYSVTDEEIKIYGLVEGYTKIEVVYESTTFTSEGAEADITINPDGSWVFPNSTEGLDLIQGSNTFLFSASDAENNSVNLRTTVILPRDSNLDLPSPPTDIKVDRAPNSVSLSWLHSDSTVAYYNIYAATTSGGGVNGYVRVNARPLDAVSYGQTKEKLTIVSELSADIETIDADLLILELNASQNDVSTDVLGSAEIPENTSRLRVESTIQSSTLETRVYFSHNRLANLTSSPPTIPVGSFTTIPTKDPLYYVVTGVRYIEGTELESSFSVEVSGSPIDLQESNLGLPNTTEADITEELIASIFDADPDASVQAGSAIRDLFVDPIASEVSRLRFVLDFTYRATNFISLIGIDDPLNSGGSLPVASSGYKQTLKDALFLDTDSQVQNLIDQAFERLSGNLGISRREGTKARGEVVFYTSATPTFDLEIPQGQIISNGSIQYRTTRSGVISSEASSSYYNPLTKRYEVAITVEAQTVGSSGNLTSGKITQGAPLGLRVTNTAPTFGGLDRETNRELASRALSYVSSVDNGTKAGYERISRESAGVESYSIIGAGDTYMVRDNGEGGKVDIWVRGEVLNEVTDVYAPTYQVTRGARFIPLYSEGLYVFKAVDASSSNPLFQMVDREGSYGLKNQTTGEFFDLTNSTISENSILTLDTSLTQPSYRLTDNILGDYRTDVTDRIVLKRQPVRAISSVKKADGTNITSYTLYKSEDPLQKGQSSLAQDYLLINNDGADKIVEVSQEEVTFNSLYPESLANRGVDITSIRVYHQVSGYEYSNQLQSSSPDYNVSVDEEGVAYLQRTSSSSIGSNQSVYVDYEHLENLVVTYTTNLVLSTLQDKIDEEKHMGADVLVKEITAAPVDVKALIYLERGSDPTSIDSLVRSNLEIRIEAEGQGGRIYSSDIIKEIDSVVGVSHVEVPLLQLSLSPQTLILRERVLSTAPVVINEIQSSSHQTWICEVPLKHIPDTSGGDGARVFLDEAEIPTLNQSQRQVLTNWSATTASIVGKEGFYLQINGQLQAVDSAEQRLILSLPKGKTPSDYKIELNYRTGVGDGYINPIILNDFSYLTSGDFSFTYEEIQG
jgi:hypothetical protein